MDGFQLRKERKKESILQAALELFSLYGAKKTSVAEIATRAGVSQVTIYNYFGSKDNLVKEAISRFMEENWKEAEDIVESSLPFPQKIDRIIMGKIEAEQQNSWFVSSISLNDPETREMIEDYYQNRSIPLLIKLIEQGKKEGFVDPEVSDEAVLFYLGAFKEAVNNPEFLSGKNKSVRLGLARLFFYGLMGKPPQQ